MINKVYQVIVIGGGASGMMAAGYSSRNGLKTLLLEKNSSLGRKLLITGKGRCNITNSGSTEELIASFGKNGRFLYRAFSDFSNNDLVLFFEHLGVKTKSERGGRIFPESDRSEDIVNALKVFLEKSGAELRLNCAVSGIEKNGDVFNVKTVSGALFSSKKVIVATGGLSYPLTGSTGDGYRFAENLGHSVTELFPALVPLETKDKFIKDLQGLSLKNVLVRIISEGKDTGSEFGEMLFTHFGVSGPCILTLSGKVSQDIKENKHVEISINFKPALTKEVLTQRLLREFDSSGKKHFSNILKNLLPGALVPVFVRLCSIPAEKPANQITKTERETLFRLLTDFRLEISKPRGFEEAIITRGGVALNEIDPYTMESKKSKGLFFCGEIIDLDGVTGGYNLQEAFSTGFLAAKGASK